MLRWFICHLFRLLLSNAKKRQRVGIIHNTDLGKSIPWRAETQYQYLQRMGPTFRHGMRRGRRQWRWKISEPPHGTGECYVSIPAWERNSSSSGVCPLKTFLKHWSRCRGKKEEPHPNDLMIAGNAVQWAPRWTRIPYCGSSEKLKEDFTVVCNSLFFSRKNVLPIQGRKLEQGDSKLEIRHILTVTLINCCNEPWKEW